VYPMVSQRSFVRPLDMVADDHPVAYTLWGYRSNMRRDEACGGRCDRGSPCGLEEAGAVLLGYDYGFRVTAELTGTTPAVSAERRTHEKRRDQAWARARPSPRAAARPRRE